MSTDMKHMEQHIEQLKAEAKRGETAVRLMENRDFRKLLLEEFCTNECARYAQASGDVSLSAESRADALANAQAAGHLRRWLMRQIQLGKTAADRVDEAEKVLESIRSGSDESVTDTE